MTYQVHALIARISAGVVIGAIAAIVAITVFAAIAGADGPGVFTLSVWVMALFIVAAIAGALAVMMWPTRYESQHAVRHAQRPAKPSKWFHPRRTRQNP